jgi:[ribosomal protein S18]-alanine N-acetyltransferase
MTAPVPPALQWSRCTVDDVDALLAIEQRVYSHPWTRGNLLDSLSAAHWAWKAMVDDELRAYWLALPVLDELHLLNLAVHPEHSGQGLGRAALAHLRAQAAGAGMLEIWLEVRDSHARAQALYESAGYVRVGRRRDYYPAAGGRREDAVLMRLRLGA